MFSLPPHAPSAKILVVKPSALGDVIHSLPFLQVMKAKFPHSQIHWVIAKGLHTLLENHPMIDRLWVIDKEAWKDKGRLGETLTGLRGLFAGLKAEKFDLVVDLQGLLRSGVITMATRCPVRVGFSQGREGSRLCYTHRVDGLAGNPDRHAVDRYLRVAQFLGCRIEQVDFPMPWMELGEEKAKCLGIPEDYVVMAPAAGGAAKVWPARRFGELAARLPVKTVVVAGSSDRHTAEEVVSSSRGAAVSVAGKTNLPELASVIRRARFMVCNDTGPMHMAAALQVPVFALFGPTNPARTGPYGSGHTVIREDLSCSPCYKRHACDSLECMEKLTVDKVHDIIMHKLGSGSSKVSWGTIQEKPRIFPGSAEESLLPCTEKSPAPM